MQEHIHRSDSAFPLSPITAALLRHRRRVATRRVQNPRRPHLYQDTGRHPRNLTETAEILGEVL